jgi:hypothetical protein
MGRLFQYTVVRVVIGKCGKLYTVAIQGKLSKESKPTPRPK